jgi:uncharacterized protein (TIGR00266 family)
MKWQIAGDSSFPLVQVNLEKGETVKAGSGAMVAMSHGLELTGKMDGGLGRAVARLFSGESFFMQNIEAAHGAGWALLAPPQPGGITQVEIKQGQELIVQKSGFLAGTPGVDVSSKPQSLVRGMFSGAGFFVVKLSGSGTAFLSTYGSIYTVDIPAGETVLIDNGHLLAWDSDVKYEVTKGASSWVSAVTSGAGFGCRFFGPAKVLVQTRNPYAFGAWAVPYLPLAKNVSSGS